MNREERRHTLQRASRTRLPGIRASLPFTLVLCAACCKLAETEPMPLTTTGASTTPQAPPNNKANPWVFDDTTVSSADRSCLAQGQQRLSRLARQRKGSVDISCLRPMRVEVQGLEVRLDVGADAKIDARSRLGASVRWRDVNFDGRIDELLPGPLLAVIPVNTEVAADQPPGSPTADPGPEIVGCKGSSAPSAVRDAYYNALATGIKCLGEDDPWLAAEFATSVLSAPTVIECTSLETGVCGDFHFDPKRGKYIRFDPVQHGPEALCRSVEGTVLHELFHDFMPKHAESDQVWACERWCAHRDESARRCCFHPEECYPDHLVAEARWTRFFHKVSRLAREAGGSECPSSTVVDISVVEICQWRIFRVPGKDRYSQAVSCWYSNGSESHSVDQHTCLGTTGLDPKPPLRKCGERRETSSSDTNLTCFDQRIDETSTRGNLVFDTCGPFKGEKHSTGDLSTASCDGPTSHSATPPRVEAITPGGTFPFLGHIQSLNATFDQKSGKRVGSGKGCNKDIACIGANCEREPDCEDEVVFTWNILKDWP